MPIKKTLPTVTIGIPAYNCAGYIGTLLKALITQKENGFVLKEIIVYCDACNDGTAAAAKKIKDKRITIIDSQQRAGMARGVVEMLQNLKTDLFVLMNDDVWVNDDHVLAKVITPFQDKKVGLVSGNPQPTKPLTFVEAAGVSTFRTYEKMRYQIDNGNNKFSCDGKFIVLSKQFVKSIQFPKDRKDMANVDSFIFFSCIKNGFLYRHVREAKIYFNFPRTIKDYLSWNSRNNSDQYILHKNFGILIDQAYYKPKGIYLRALLGESIKNPIGCALVFGLGIYCGHKAKSAEKWLSPTWDVVATTKLSK